MQLVPTVIVVNKSIRTTRENPLPQALHRPIFPSPVPLPVTTFRLPLWIVPDSREWERNLPKAENEED